MAEIAIRVTDVYKSFKIYFDKGQSFKEKILFQNRNRHESRAVLNGISFEVKRGEAVGLIGQNGCGKSTMLKLLTKIMYPDTGNIEMKGRVSSLIELGAGFHQDMTGKENIYTNASIFGLTRKEIDARIAKIIDFSELGEFIDNPVRTYSSGMYTRLAFAVAINVDADILLIDEILAVGDANFQAKCFNKMQEIKRQGTTIVIVSHDMSSIERLCDRAIWIKDGLIALEDNPRKTVYRYLDDVMNGGYGATADSLVDATPARKDSRSDNAVDDATSDQPKSSQESGNRFVEIINVLIDNLQGVKAYSSGENIKMEISYCRHNPKISDAAVGIRIYRMDGLDCFGTNTIIDNNFTIPLKDKGIITLLLQGVPLLQGSFTVDVAIHSAVGQTYHHVSDATGFSVYSQLQEVGVVHIKHEWIY